MARGRKPTYLDVKNEMGGSRKIFGVDGPIFPGESGRVPYALGQTLIDKGHASERQKRDGRSVESRVQASRTRRKAVQKADTAKQEFDIREEQEAKE